MNPAPDDNPRDWMERMLIKLREGEATTDEVTQLRELLATNAVARLAFVRARQMDTLLETVPMQPAVLSAAPVPGARGARWWKIVTLASAVAAAVALAFLLFGSQWNDGRDSDATVAVLKSSFEAVIDGREVLEGEQPMRAGTYKLERGSVQLLFGCGAEVVIEGPAAFDLVDATTMHLNEGSLWAHCPEVARGFAVRMPGGRELVDFGTEFGARVNAEGGAQVKVLQGEVKIHDAVSQSLDLTAGKAAGWELTAPPLAMNAAEVKPFQSSTTLAEKVQSATRVNPLAVVWFTDPKGGEWNRVENWTSGAVPGAHQFERVVINQSRVVRVLPGLPPPPHPVDIHVSNGPPSGSAPEATLEILGNLECQALRIALTDGSHGVVRQTGGTVNVTETLIASPPPGNSVSRYTLSDGALNVGHEMRMGVSGLAEFTLVGSRATVTADSLRLGPHAVLTFVLDSDGAGLVKLRDTLLRHPQSRLVINGAQYRGGGKTLPLVVCGSSSADKVKFTLERVRFDGFAGVTPSLAFRSGGLDLVLKAQ